jgi:hypothetical protein
MNLKSAGSMCCKFLVLGSFSALVFIGLPAFADFPTITRAVHTSTAPTFSNI